MRPSLDLQKNITYIVILLTIVGIGVASYLSQQVFVSSEFTPCPLFGGGGCTAVLHGPYSKLFGIFPLAYLGVLYYLGAMLIAIIAVKKRQQKFFNYVAYISLVGFASSVVFVGLQVFVIKNICFWCVLSAITTTLMFIATIPILFRKKEESMQNTPPMN